MQNLGNVEDLESLQTPSKVSSEEAPQQQNEEENKKEIESKSNSRIAEQGK